MLSLLLLPAMSSALSLSTVSNVAVDASLSGLLAVGPCLIPQVKKGYEAMQVKYTNAPNGTLFDTNNWRGVFPEYDFTNAPLSTDHVVITIAAAFFLFLGAFEQARVEGVDMNDVYAMALYAFAFQGDSLTHAVLSNGDDGANGNIMQKGHSLDTWPMIAFFLYANYLDGGAWYALTDLPADGWWMLIPRIATSPLFLLITFYLWQPAHGAGLWLEKDKVPSFK